VHLHQGRLNDWLTIVVGADRRLADGPKGNLAGSRHDAMALIGE
jgi:hypothetical protein